MPPGLLRPAGYTDASPSVTIWRVVVPDCHRETPVRHRCPCTGTSCPGEDPGKEGKTTPRLECVGWQQKELAQAARLDVTTVNRMEGAGAGQVRSLPQNVQKVLDALARSPPLFGRRRSLRRHSMVRDRSSFLTSGAMQRSQAHTQTTRGRPLSQTGTT
jgi:hypothetical protein